MRLDSVRGAFLLSLKEIPVNNTTFSFTEGEIHKLIASQA